jgi:calcium permeable stress-gated cation channel
MFSFTDVVSAHRYLVGYVYSRGGAGEQGGLLQIWLIRRFASVMSLQPLLLGLIFFSHHLWVLGGILTGVGTFLVIAAEVYAVIRCRQPGRNSLPLSIRQSLTVFKHIALQKLDQDEESKSQDSHDEHRSFTSRERLSQARSRGSLASVLEMMSITLATVPSNLRQRLPLPLGGLLNFILFYCFISLLTFLQETEDLDDLTATDRAARTHPAAPPHLPPLPFEDRARETSGMLYPPEMLADPPTVWLPNDQNGIARAEAYDLQRYHDLAVVLDLRKDTTMIRT